MNEILYSIFSCGGCHLLKEGELEEMEVLEKEIGSRFIHPICNECFKPLTIGDQIDGYHPYYQEYNFCKLCKDHMIEPEKEKESKRFKELHTNKVQTLKVKGK